MGDKYVPANILIAVMPNRIAATIPTSRTHVASTLGVLTSRRATLHRATPAPKAGTLASKLFAVPESITASPMAYTRNPAATTSHPLRKNFRASRLVAMTNALESIAQEISRTVAELTIVPSIPRTAPITKPMQARMFRLLSAAAFIAVRESSSRTKVVRKLAGLCTRHEACGNSGLGSGRAPIVHVRANWHRR